MKNFFIIISFVSLLIIFPIHFSFAINQSQIKSSDMISRLKGKILLKVEDKGQAYYVNPDNLKMYSLGLPSDAFQVMRELGLGISNQDMDQISVEEVERLKKEYDYHDYYPIILSFCDCKSNCYNNSENNGYIGYSHRNPEAFNLKINDEICLKVEARDPQNRQILYKWWSSGTDGVSKVYNDWSINNQIQYKVISEDAKRSGENFRIGVKIKSDKEYYRAGGNGYDDGICIDYHFIIAPEIIKPNYQQ